MRPGVLVVLDGIGIQKQKKGNAFELAKKPFFDWMEKNCPKTVLQASGNAVGLPSGFMGNSEVGHITLGSGRIVWQAMKRISQSIRNKTFFQNPAFLKAIANCKKHRSAMHLMGLVSDKGVHSNIRHLFALLEFCKKQKIGKAWIHFFSDGRDTKPKEALRYLKMLEKKMKTEKTGKIGTVIGRYFAMDRDKRWKRTKKAFECLATAKGILAKNARSAIRAAYARGESDEFIPPTAIDGFEGIQKNDSLVFFNFRLDRGRQLTQAFAEKKFVGFKRKRIPLCFVAMCPYYAPMNALVAFEEPHLKNVLGEALSKKGLKQLRIAETEKYAHVTYFFNGENEKPFKGEKRILIPSPKVATYDQVPAMRANEIAEKTVKALKKGKTDAVVCNFANGDMVGHTGNLKACIQSIQALDSCVAKIAKEVLRKNGFVVVTADHGNCESMGTKKEPQKNHTTNPVACWIVSRKRIRIQKKGGLSNIAPTFLELLGIQKPVEMSAKSLLLH